MPENILIIAVKMPQRTEERFQSSLEELISLCKTAGGIVKEVITQKRERIHRGHYLGMGKINETLPQLEEMEIDLIIANDELTAGQIRNLTESLGVHVIDRSQLILDIFAMRAHTKEGKLQVELAQLEYMLPRLHGQGHVLSRLGAGIGTRGPGETKLETDRRHIRNRIFDIKRRLKLAAQQRTQYRKRRRENACLQIALAGYTNAGKSTIFNRISNSNSLEEDQLFATLDPLTRKIQLPSGLHVLLTDTVGFLEDLPTALIESFKSTLEEVAEADFILHVVDASHPDQVQHQKTVHKLLEELDADSIQTLTVYNKKDKFTGDFFPLEHPNISISAYRESDIKELLKEIETLLKGSWERYDVEILANEGKLLNRAAHETIMTNQHFDEEKSTYHVQGFIRNNHPLSGRLKEK